MYRVLAPRLTSTGLYELAFDKGGEIHKDLDGKYTRKEEALSAAHSHLALHPEKHFTISDSVME